METGRIQLFWKLAMQNSSLLRVALVCLVAVLGYLAATLGGALILRPQMVWPLLAGQRNSGIVVIAGTAQALADTSLRRSCRVCSLRSPSRRDDSDYRGAHIALRDHKKLGWSQLPTTFSPPSGSDLSGCL